MVNVAATNGKLRGRAVTILAEATDLDESLCIEALAAADGELTTALVCLLTECGPEESRRALQTCQGRVRAAVAAVQRT